MKRAAAIVFALMLSLCCAKTAQAQAVPEDIQGMWWMRNCAYGKMVIVYSDYFLLEATKYGAGVKRILRVEPMPRGAWRVSRPDFRYDVKRRDEDTLLIRYAHPSRDKPDPFDGAKDYAVRTFVSCKEGAAPLATLTDEGLAIFHELDAVDAACRKVDIRESEACQTGLFDAFDESGDGRLDRRELALVSAKAAFLGASNSCAAIPSSPDPEADAIGDFTFASAVLILGDRNGDQGVTLAELRQSRTVLLADPGIANLLDLTGLLADLFPFLKKIGRL